MHINLRSYGALLLLAVIYMNAPIEAAIGNSIEQDEIQSQPQPQSQGQARQFGVYNPGYVPTVGPSIGHSPNKPYRPLGGDQQNPVLDRFSHRYPDGSYEFRYELADGSARYERGYFLLVDKIKTLVVVGYYSYRMTDGRYITVFYNADQHGYRQNQSITEQVYPNLPRSIDVPQYKDEPDYGSRPSTTPYPRISSTTTRRNGYF